MIYMSAAMPNVAGIVSTVSLVINILVALFLVASIFIGYKRGLIPTLIRLGTVILTAGLSLVGTLLFRDRIAEPIDAALKSLLDDDTFNQLTQSSESLTQLLHELPAALVAPIVFLAFYLVLNLIFYIVFKILTKLHVFSKEILVTPIFGKLPTGKTVGAVVNVAIALLMVMCVIVPFSGYVAMADDVANAVESVEGLDSEITETVQWADDEIITPLSSNITFRTSNALLGKPVFNTVTVCKVGGENVVIAKEANFLANTYVTVSPLLENFDLTSFGEEEANILRKFAADFGNSKLALNIAGEIIPSAATAWNEGDTFIGIANPLGSMPEGLNSLKTNLMNFMLETSPQTLQSDICTVADLVATLAESGTLTLMSGNASTKDILDALSKPGAISGIIETLYNSENANIQAMAADVANLGFQAIAESLNIPKTDEDVRQNMISDMSAEIVEDLAIEDYDTRVSTLSADIKAVFDKYGVDAGEDEARLYAECIAGYGTIEGSNPETVSEDYFKIINIAMGETVTPLASQEDLLKEAIQKYLDNGGQKAQVLAKQVIGEEKLEHAVITLEVILVTSDELFDMSEEQLKQQTAALEVVVAVLAEIVVVDEETSEISVDIQKIDTETLSGALQEFGDTRTDEEGNEKKNLASAVTNIVKSTLQQTGIDASAANNLVEHLVEKQPEVEGEPKKDTLSTTLKLVGIIQSENVSKEEMRESVDALVRDLDPTSAKIIADCISPNLIKKYANKDLSEERTNALVVIIKDILFNFGDLSDDLSEEQLDAEASSLQSILNLTTAASSANKSHIFNLSEEDKGSLDMTAAEFLVSIQRSTVILKTFTKDAASLEIAIGGTMKEADKAALIEALNNAPALDPALKDALYVAFSLSPVEE